MNHPKFIPILLLLFAILLAACTTEPQTPSTSAPTPTNLPPTQTAVPTTAPAQPTATQPAASQSPLLEETFPELAELEYSAVSYPSPNGSWEAIAISSVPLTDDDGSQRFFNALAVTDGQTIQPIVGEWRPYGLGYLSTQPYRWSKNNRDLYYTYNISADGCSLFTQSTDLYRYNLRSGETAELLGPNTTPSPLDALSLSPDETKVAFIYRQDFYDIPNGGRILALRTLNTDLETEVPLTETGQSAQAGEIVWSPDQTFLALAIAYQPCTPDWTQSLLLVETRQLTYDTIIDQDGRLFTPTAWLDNQTIELTDKDLNPYTIDIMGNTITPRQE